MYLYRHAIYFTNILKDDSNHYLSEIKNWKKCIFQFLNSIPEQEPTRTAIEIRVKVKQEGNAKRRRRRCRRCWKTVFCCSPFWLAPFWVNISAISMSTSLVQPTKINFDKEGGKSSFTNGGKGDRYPYSPKICLNLNHLFFDWIIFLLIVCM